MKTKINITLAIILLLAIISITIHFLVSLGMLDSLRIVFGSVYVLFLPGFIISYIFFPKTREFEENKRESSPENRRLSGIDWLERIALSFALSIAIVPLAVFYLNLIGVKINILNSFLTILGILIISSGILYWKNRRRK